ncbi:MAG: hypothetical protein AAGJ54_09680 [Planctomycetota bacterium]
MPTPVRVLIPTRVASPELLRACVRGVLERTSGVDVRVTVLDTSAGNAARAALGELCEKVRIARVELDGPFRFGPVMNDAVRSHDERAVLLLNDDTRVPETPALPGVDPDRWLAAMLGELDTPGVAAVGAVLLYPNRTIQHAGIIHGAPDGLLAHAGRGLSIGGKHAARFVRAREVTAVTGACMMLDREAFLEAGGFDDAEMAEAYHDPDLCHRLRDRGLSTRLAGDAILFHHEGATRGTDDDPACHAAYKRAHTHRMERFGDAAEVLLGGPGAPGAGSLVFDERDDHRSVPLPDRVGGTASKRLHAVVERVSGTNSEVAIEIGLGASKSVRALAKRRRVIWVLPEPDPRGHSVDGQVRTLDVSATDRAALVLVVSEWARSALRSCGVRSPIAVLRPPIDTDAQAGSRNVNARRGEKRILIPTGEPPVPCPASVTWDPTPFGSVDWPESCAQSTGVVLHPFVEPDAGLVLDLLERGLPIVAPRAGVCGEVLRAVPGVEMLPMDAGLDQALWSDAIEHLQEVTTAFDALRSLSPAIGEMATALQRWAQAVGRS